MLYYMNKPISSYNQEVKLKILSNLSDPNELPYVSTRYVQPTFDISEDVSFEIYTSDYYQVDYQCYPPRYVDFELIINLDGTIYTQLIKSGERILTLGKLSKGEHYFTLQVKDKFNRYSHELYNEFRVIDTLAYETEISNHTYIVTDEDLNSYEIDKNDNETNALITKQGLQQLFNDKASEGVRKLILPNGIYQIEAEITFAPGLSEDATDDEKALQIQYNKNVLSIPNNFILDLNGSTLKLKTTPWYQNQSFLIEINGKYDSHIINGILEGDYRRRSNEPLPNGNPSAEGGACARIIGDSRYCSLEDLTIKLFTGYACTVGVDGAIVNFKEVFNNFTNINIDNTGNEVYEKDKWTSDYYKVPENMYDSTTALIGQYLGNGYFVQSDSWNVDYHLYDENKNLIKTVHGFQYREFLKPNNIRYIRCTYYCKTTENRQNPASYLENIGLYLIDYYKPRNCMFKNLYFYDTRTCGMNPNQTNNFLIEGCKFDNCATNITPIAVDFEDGWYLMQDYMFRNNEVIVPVGTGDVVSVGGMNITFEENKNFRITMQGHFGIGFLFRNNINTQWIKFKKDSRLEYQYNMMYGDHYSVGGSGLIAYTSNKLPAYIKDIKCNKTVPAKLDYGMYINAFIDYENYSELPAEYYILAAPQGKYLDSIIKNFTGWNQTRTTLSATDYINCEFSNFKGILRENNKMTNCTINNLILTYDNYNGDIIFTNCIINNFILSYIATWNPTLTIEFIDCEIDNSTSGDGLYLLIGNFNLKNNKSIFTFKFNNCKFKNGTKIVTDEVLINENIIFEINNDCVFE